jgi:hypothetical protein
LLASIAWRLSRIKRFAIRTEYGSRYAAPGKRCRGAYLRQICNFNMAGGSPILWLPRTRSIMLFFVWYDDSPKKLVADKIEEAITAYVARFARRPSLVLVNVADHMELPHVLVRSERTVQPNSFWLGHEDTVDIP